MGNQEFSLLDGYGTIFEYAKRKKEINQRFLCVTDHGSLGAVPRQVQECEEYGIEPIFGIELYVNNLQPILKVGEKSTDYAAGLSQDERKFFRKANHLLAIAKSEVGYKNLVNLSSMGWSGGLFNGKPRVNHECLLKHKEGIIFTSCCYNSEIGQAFDRGGDDAGFAMIEHYIGMFGKENFYLEIMLLDFSKQKPYNCFILRAADRYGLPIILTQDCHYCMKEDSYMQQLMLMIQRGTTIADIKKAQDEEEGVDIFELQDTNLWMKSEEELNEKWLRDFQDTIPLEVFEQAKLNTVKIAEMCRGVKLDRSIKLPYIESAEDKLAEAIQIGFKKRRLPQTAEYQRRMVEEYQLICKKGFASYFLIQKMMTDEARRISPQILGFGSGCEAVGPGRGCLAGESLIVVDAYKSVKIHDIEPGDYVLTRDGRYREVIRKFTYDSKEILYRINQELKLTGDHFVWIKRNDKFDWIRADELAIGDMMYMPSVFVEGDGELLPITDIDRVPNPEGKVYDLEIAGAEENFCTILGIVHNSAVGSLVCYCLGITDVNPIEHDLLFSRFLSPARGGKTMKLRFSIDPINVTEEFAKECPFEIPFESGPAERPIDV